MVEQHIQFNDGDAYDRSMGVWSQLAGEVFLDWLAPSTGLRWIDIGWRYRRFHRIDLQTLRSD